MSQPPQSDQMRASGSGRRKVALPPGRSQLDWVKNSTRLIPPRPRTISLKELKKHRSKTDVWMAINLKVYDVTPYVEYHPGGIPMIISGAGKDATTLFNKYHSWVNPEFMLRNCYLGMLDDDEDEDEEKDEDDDEDEEKEDEDEENDLEDKECVAKEENGTTASKM